MSADEDSSGSESDPPDEGRPSSPQLDRSGEDVPYPDASAAVAPDENSSSSESGLDREGRPSSSESDQSDKAEPDLDSCGARQPGSEVPDQGSSSSESDAAVEEMPGPSGWESDPMDVDMPDQHAQDEVVRLSEPALKYCGHPPDGAMVNYPPDGAMVFCSLRSSFAKRHSSRI